MISKITVLFPYYKMKDYSAEMTAAGEKKITVVAAFFRFYHLWLFVYTAQVSSQKNIAHTHQ